MKISSEKGKKDTIVFSLTASFVMLTKAAAARKHLAPFEASEELLFGKIPPKVGMTTILVMRNLNMSY